jgi:hypothetical protein
VAVGAAKIPDQELSLVRMVILNPQLLAKAPAVALNTLPLNLQRLGLQSHKAVHQHQNPQPQKQDQRESSPQALSVVHYAPTFFVAARLEDDMNRDNLQDDNRYHRL